MSYSLMKSTTHFKPNFFNDCPTKSAALFSLPFGWLEMVMESGSGFSVCSIIYTTRSVSGHKVNVHANLLYEHCDVVVGLQLEAKVAIFASNTDQLGPLLVVGWL